MTMPISCSGRAAGSTATRSFSSALTATAGIVIAAWNAAARLASTNADAPTAGTSAVPKGGSIIAIGSGTIGIAGRPPQQA